MVRHLSLDNKINNSQKSPAGFWPNPDKEFFLQATDTPPPWEVPKKRKTRGRTQDFYYYD